MAGHLFLFLSLFGAFVTGHPALSCPGLFPALDATALPAAGPKKLAVPVEVSFMCAQGMVVSLIAKETFAELLARLNIRSGMTVTNQGAEQTGSQEDGVDRFSEAEAVRKLWDKDYVIELVELNREKYRAVAEALKTPNGRRALAARLHALGEHALADEVSGGKGKAPVFLTFEDVPVPKKERGPSNEAFHNALLKLILIAEVSRGNSLEAFPVLK